MRVMMVGPTGTVAMQRPVRWVAEAGHDVLLVDYRRQFPPPLPPGVRFVPLLARGASAMARRFHTTRHEPLIERVGAWQVRALAAWFRPDVLHVHKLDFRARGAARAGVHPLVLSAWGTLNHLLMDAVPFTDLEVARRVLRATDLLLVESPALVEPVRALAEGPLRVELLPLGTDTRRFAPPHPDEVAAWRAAVNVPRDATVLLSPRGWSPLYRHDAILEAFAQARPCLPHPAVLVFLTMGLGHYREAGDLYHDLKQRAAALGVAEAVRWLKPVPHREMRRVYGLADVVVNFPATDAFPSTLVEAAACERPILSSALPTYVGTFIEEYATLVPPDDPDALAAAMVELVNHLPDRAHLRAARRAVVENYDEERMKQRLLGLYEKVAFSR